MIISDDRTMKHDGARPTRFAQPRLWPETASACQRVRGEYLEMPGLRLTEGQAARLLGLAPGALSWCPREARRRRLPRPNPRRSLLRVMSFSAGRSEHQVPGGGLLKGRAEWPDRAVVADGQVAVKQGLLKRNVPFEEVWQLDEAARTLTVITTLKTPLGVKRRTQVFTRVTEDAPRDGEARSPTTPRHIAQKFLPQT